MSVVVPFETTTVEDSTLARGTIRIKIAGVDGENVEIYEAVYEDDVKTEQRLVRTETIRRNV